MFLESWDNIHDATSDQITFCEDVIIPKKTVKVYPNPAVAKDQLERKRAQSKLRKEIREAKKQYKEKVEFQFQTGNMRDPWKGLKTLTGQSRAKLISSNIPSNKRTEFSD